MQCAKDFPAAYTRIMGVLRNTLPVSRLRFTVSPHVLFLLACGRAFPACPKSLFGGTDEAFPNDGRGCPVSLRSVFVPLIRGVWRGDREVDPRRCVPDGCAEGVSPAFRRSVSRIRNVKIFYFRECIIIHKRPFLPCLPEVFRLRACRRLRTVNGGEVCKQL